MTLADAPLGGDAAEESRRDEILRLAAEVIAEQGFRNTSVRHIAERADMLSGSLFYHFRTKDAMAEELLRPTFEAFVQTTRDALLLEGTARERIEAMARGYVTALGGRNLIPTRILFNDWRYLSERLPFLADGMREINALWLAVLEEGTASGAVRSDVDLSILFNIVRGVFADVVRWYEPGGHYGLEDIAAALTPMIFDGMLARPARSAA